MDSIKFSNLNFRLDSITLLLRTRKKSTPRNGTSINFKIRLMMDFKKTKDSLKSRGFNANTSIFTYQTYGNIIAMIFIKALKKSEDMKHSMNARGFTNRIYFINSSKIELLHKLLFFTIVIISIKVVYELFS